MLFPFESLSVSVIGLGYVGLPLAVAISDATFDSSFCKDGFASVTGFDISVERIKQLSANFDKTNEISSNVLQKSRINVTSNINDLSNTDIFIISVPTPVDSNNHPDFSCLVSATSLACDALLTSYDNSLGFPKKPLFIYESTVYPGATEEICVPIIESKLSLQLNHGFFVGYSPERINPGDHTRNLADIVKVTSGSDDLSSQCIDLFYSSFIHAGTHKCGSIKVAEAAKVIENTQRDLNIALINEIAIICSKLNIDTNDVLAAASTKWNFLNFKPGLVGGHCIGVDPYYLTYKSEELGYRPELVLAGRRINDNMASWVSSQLLIKLTEHKVYLPSARLLVMGLTFKEDCPDFRNSQVPKIIDFFLPLIAGIDVVDPFILDSFVQPIASDQVSYYSSVPKAKYDAIIICVAHREFLSFTSSLWNSFLQSNGLILDLKNICPRDVNPIRL